MEDFLNIDDFDTHPQSDDFDSYDGYDAFCDGWGPEEYEPNPYDGTYSED